MKRDRMLTISSLLSIFLLSIHLSQDAWKRVSGLIPSIAREYGELNQIPQFFIAMPGG